MAGCAGAAGRGDVEGHHVARAEGVGREVRGVPLGLVVYAGRNQYCHLDEEALQEPSRSLFSRLASGHGLASRDAFKDPAFDLDTVPPEFVAANIVSLIGWLDYRRYEADVLQLLAG